MDKIITEGGTDPLWIENLSGKQKPALRLFCVPYAGGNAEFYRSWQTWFPEEVSICLVHLPGRCRRAGEPPFTRAVALAKTLAERMRSEITVPHALYGHSMGALISFELSWELIRRYGTGPQHLFVSGRGAPQWPRSRPPTFNLPYEGFLGELKRLKGTPREVLESPHLLKMFLGVLRADFELVETYEYQHERPLNCPITVYSGLEDENVSPESCRAWADQTTSDFNIKMFAGGHFFMRDSRTEFVNMFQKDVLNAIPR